MIQGEDIYLRPLKQDDVEILFDWENRQENLEVSPVHGSVSREDLSLYIENEKDLHLDKQWRLMICSKNHEALGTIDLFDYNPKTGEAGIGILVAEEKDRRKGVAGQAINMLTSYAFAMFNLKIIYCHVQEHNAASHGLFLKQGFELSEVVNSEQGGNEKTSKYVLKNNTQE
jgi:diamine N-acetyltransferase